MALLFPVAMMLVDILVRWSGELEVRTVVLEHVNEECIVTVLLFGLIFSLIGDSESVTAGL